MLKKITVDVTRKNVKNMTLRVLRDGTVTMTVPLTTPEPEWHRFLDEKQAWLEKALAKSAALPQYDYSYGELHWLLGRQVRLELFPGLVDRCVLRGDRACVTYKRWTTAPQKVVAKAWGEQLAAVLEPMLSRWSRRMGVSYAGFSVTATRSRWGSCNTRTGALRFSLELSAKPLDCVELVVVHELCHLLEPTHNAHFHALMDEYLPDWKERKQKLAAFPREFY